MASLVWDRLPWSAAYLLAVAQELQQVETRGRIAKRLKTDRKAS